MELKTEGEKDFFHFFLIESIWHLLNYVIYIHTVYAYIYFSITCCAFKSNSLTSLFTFLARFSSSRYIITLHFFLFYATHIIYFYIFSISWLVFFLLFSCVYYVNLLRVNFFLLARLSSTRYFGRESSE